MKFTRSLLAITTLLFFITESLYSQEYWTRQNSPTTNYLNDIQFINNSTGWIGGNGGTIIHTTNNGNNWTIQNTGVDNDIEEIFFIDQNTGWALAWQVNPDTVYFAGTKILKTINGGLNWSLSMFPDTNRFLRSVFFFDANTGFVCGYPSLIFRTTNGGINWLGTNIDSTNKFILPLEKIKFYDSQIGFACGGFRDIAGFIWRTTDGGLNWSIKHVAPEPMNDIIIFDQNRSISVGGDFEYGSSYVSSTDQGVNWTYDTLGVFGAAKAIDFRNANEGWIAVGQKFAFTQDTGHTWNNIDTPDKSFINDIFFSDSLNGWSAGYDGVILKYNPTPVGIKGIENSEATSFTLYQNFPNPFNPKTIFNYQLSMFNYVTLKVYNALGYEISTVVNQNQKPGNYKVEFDAGSLPSGVYFYQLTAGNFSQSRKMLLLK